MQTQITDATGVDPRDLNEARAREAIAALGDGFEAPMGWQDTVYSCADAGCSHPETKKPFASTPTKRLRVGEGANSRLMNALWFRVGETDLKKGIRCLFHMRGETTAARKPVYDRVLAETTDEVAAKKAAAAVRPFVSLAAVFATASRDLRIAEGGEDGVEARVARLERQVFPCRVQLAGDACVKQAELRDLQGFDVNALRTVASTGADVTRISTASQLVALVTDKARRDEQGLPPLICRACGAEAIKGLGRKVMVKARDGDTYEQTLLVPASVVAKRILRSDERQGERSASLGKLGEFLRKEGVESVLVGDSGNPNAGTGRTVADEPQADRRNDGRRQRRRGTHWQGRNSE